MRPRWLWRMQGRLRFRKLHGRLVHVSRAVRGAAGARDEAEYAAGARSAAVAGAERPAPDPGAVAGAKLRGYL